MQFDTKILVIGDAMLDKYYFGEVTRISPEAPVPINHVTRIKETLGGAANVAHNLALLGCQTFLIAHIGNDFHGETLTRNLQARGIDTSGAVYSDIPTTTKIRIIGGAQQMLRLDFEEKAAFDADAFLKKIDEKLPEVDAVIISDYGKGVCSEKLCREIIKRGKIVTIDPKGDDWSKYAGANFITPNFKEFNAILPKKIANAELEIEKAARETIAALKLQGLIVTRSAQGLSIIEKSATHIKAQAQEVFDVSGAGDTVIAVFTAALAGGLKPEQAARLANAAAGIVVAKVGTYAVSREELIERVGLK